jgi:sugar phosphate isomerase/epimerase
VYEFGDRIFSCHAKDVEIMRQYAYRNGMLTPGVWSGGRCEKRSWRFRIPGWGDINWRQLISALVEVGYDYVISFENEDPIMSCEDGARKAYWYLKPLIIEKRKMKASNIQYRISEANLYKVYHIIC